MEFIGYLAVGFAMMSFNTGTAYSAIGLIIMIGAIGNVIIKLLKKPTS